MELLLGILNGGNNVTCQLLERVRKLVFLFGGFPRRGASFGIVGDGSVGVEAAQGAVAFLQNTVAFFDLGFYLLDELFFVALVFLLAFFGFDELWLSQDTD